MKKDILWSLAFMALFTAVDFYLLNQLLDPYDYRIAGLDSRVEGLESQLAQKNSSKAKKEVKSDT